MEDKNKLLPELATINLPERKLQRTDEIVYWDRRIWKYENPDTGETSDTVDKIRELLDDSEITKDQIIVTQPVFTELPVFDEFKQYILEGLGEGKIPRAIVIPQRTKAETYDGHTIRVNVSSEDFIELGKKLDVPIYQIDVGRIYPPSKEVQRKREEEAKKEYEPRYQKNIDIVIKTESGKVICIDSSPMLNIFFPRGTFTEDERLAALRKTFPEGQPFYEPPDYFNKHYASKLKEGRFRGLRLDAGASKWKGGTIQSLWFGILDGKELTSTQTAGNPSFQSVREDGAAESHIFSQGDYDTVLFMEEMGKAEVDEEGNPINTTLRNFIGNITEEFIDSQPEFLEEAKKGLPKFLVHLLGDEKVSSICVSRTVPMFVPYEYQKGVQIIRPSGKSVSFEPVSSSVNYWYRGRDTSIGTGSFYEQTSLELGQNETLLRSIADVPLGLRLEFSRRRIYPGGISPKKIAPEIEELRVI